MTDGVTLRRSVPADLDFVIELERRPDHIEVIGQWTELEHLSAMQSPRREHWIAERDAVRAGYLIAFDGRSAGVGIYLKRILVADKGRGTGRSALMRFIGHALLELEAPFVWLHVRDGNVRAQALYRSLGLRRFDPTPDVARVLDAVAEPAEKGGFRMLLKKGDWRPMRS